MPGWYVYYHVLNGLPLPADAAPLANGAGALRSARAKNAPDAKAPQGRKGGKQSTDRKSGQVTTGGKAKDLAKGGTRGVAPPAANDGAPADADEAAALELPSAIAFYFVLRGVPLPRGGRTSEHDASEEEVSLTGAHLKPNPEWEATLSFDDRLYWEYFHVDQGRAELFDWYSASDMLVDAIARVAAEQFPDRTPQSLRVLDLGMGTSPLLFDLAERGYSALTGVDFSPVSVAFMRAEAASRGLTPPFLRLEHGDVTALDAFADGSFDLCVDKGTLDCLVNGRGHANVPRYLGQVARLLDGPHARFLLVASNSADVPYLLTRGAIRRDTLVEPGDTRPDSLPVARVANETVVPSSTPILAVTERCARDTRHLFVARAAAPAERPSVCPPIVCDYCGEVFTVAELPVACACGNKLYRMFV